MGTRMNPRPGRKDALVHCSGISLIFGSKISHLDVKLDIRVGELISVVKQP